ncbi:helix-turn-helix domain-containing protein [Serratia marcescens]|uniref:helix-turn-helix domain-containing protein n=1 Tax=Serratia marcescens TaxID=615 RepID=UPI0007455A0D|nr:helix-turn-helix transcriptional regulator [Serratia marcescens]EJD6704603.1 helix-turn-helix transcriptional regulator [Serratia marcescens]CUY72335.1 Antitoxin PezA [Serratia marcescens]CVD71775.1 Antitoxin PezA [Serratia marcescens]
MKLSEKIKAIRESEDLSQVKFCEIIGLSINTLKKYEGGKFEPGGEMLTKITQHPQFEKYTLWLMTGKTMPEVGQISPALSPDGQSSTSNHQSDQKAG